MSAKEMINSNTEADFISGNEDALDDIVRMYTPLAAAVIRNIAQDALSPEDVEEVAADTFTALWFYRKKIILGCLKSYLCAIAKSKTMDRLRRIEKSPVVSTEDEDIEDDLMVEEEVEDREISEALSKALSRLGKKDREIVVRHYYFRQSTATIAEIMKMPCKTVQTRLIRAKFAIFERSY